MPWTSVLFLLVWHPVDLRIRPTDGLQSNLEGRNDKPWVGTEFVVCFKNENFGGEWQRQRRCVGSRLTKDLAQNDIRKPLANLRACLLPRLRLHSLRLVVYWLLVQTALTGEPLLWLVSLPYLVLSYDLDV